MSRWLFYGVLVSFLVGVGVGLIFETSYSVGIWGLFVAAALLLVSLRWSQSLGSWSVLLVGVLLIGYSLGLLRSHIAAEQFGNSSLVESVSQEVSLIGKVIKEPEIRNTTQHLYVETGDDTVLVTTDRYVVVGYGDEVEVTGELKIPESFVGELGRTFNYPAYLKARGVEYQIPFAQVSIRSSGQGNPVITFLLKQKSVLVMGIERVLTEPQAGLGEGLLLGVKQALGEELETAFRTSGIIHIVVLSGQNVMLVVAFILFVLSWLLPRKLRLMVGLIMVAGFAVMVGLSATVVRASVMVGLFLVAQLLGRTYDLPRSLLFAAVLMVLHNPYILLYDLGFQFSFMATLGLILVAPQFESFLAEGFARIGIKEFIVATIATQVAVLPLLLYHVGEISLVAVAVNILVLPVVPLAMLTTWVAGLVGVFSTTLALPAALLAHGSLSYIIGVATFFASLPFAAVTVPVFPAAGMLLLYGLIAGLGWMLHIRRMREQDPLQGWVIEEEKEKPL